MRKLEVGWKCGVDGAAGPPTPLFWERGGSEQMEEGDVKKCNPQAPSFALRAEKRGFCSMQSLPTNDNLRQRGTVSLPTLSFGAKKQQQ